MLIDHQDVPTIHATTGEFLRALTINPRAPLPRHRTTTTRRPPRAQTNQRPEPLMGVQAVLDVSRHHMARSEGFEPPTF